MIRFKCICGQTFELPDDRANDQFQCDLCLRLVDVPGLGEVDSLENDGTVKMRESEQIAPDLLEKVRIHSHHDDLRQTVDEYLSIDDLAPADAPPTKMPPRYDPITGELLEEIDIVPDARPPAHEIPLATATLNYASVATEHALERGDIRWWQAPWRILTGMSLMAMFFVFLSHVIVHLCLLTPGVNVLLFLPALLIVLAIIAHYGNTMEEFGPHNHDEVPVMLRHVSFSDDIAGPLFGMLIAWVVAFAPMIFCWMFGLGPILRDQPWAWIVLIGWGLFFFPAAAFTAITSGAIQNMLPHHVFAVIRVAPGRYLLAWGAFMIGIGAYVSALGGMTFTSIAVFTSTAAPGLWGTILMGVIWLYASMLAAIYFMHLSAVWMGLIYRSHHAKFNWAWQQHQKQVRTDTLAQLSDMRRKGDPRLNRKISSATLKNPRPQQTKLQPPARP